MQTSNAPTLGQTNQAAGTKSVLDQNGVFAQLSGFRSEDRKGGYSRRRTCSCCGPCTPTTRVSSMSAVLLGPVTKVIALLKSLDVASARRMGNRSLNPERIC